MLSSSRPKQIPGLRPSVSRFLLSTTQCRKLELKRLGVDIRQVSYFYGSRLQKVGIWARAIYAGFHFASSVSFGVGGQSYFNFLASTVRELRLGVLEGHRA